MAIDRYGKYVLKIVALFIMLQICNFKIPRVHTLPSGYINLWLQDDGSNDSSGSITDKSWSQAGFEGDLRVRNPCRCSVA